MTSKKAASKRPAAKATKPVDKGTPGTPLLFRVLFPSEVSKRHLADDGVSFLSESHTRVRAVFASRVEILNSNTEPLRSSIRFKVDYRFKLIDKEVEVGSIELTALAFFEQEESATGHLSEETFDLSDFYRKNYGLVHAQVATRVNDILENALGFKFRMPLAMNPKSVDEPEIFRRDQ